MSLAVILVSPKYPGNVGAVARVMKNFGAGPLILVDARADCLDEEAFSLAAGAGDILRSALQVETLKRAVAAYSAIIGTTSLRHRKVKQPIEEIRSFRETFRSMDADRSCLVLGAEDRGLSREELLLVTHLVTIPTVPEFPTLNLAQSAAICLHELSDPSNLSQTESEAATNEERETAYTHLQEALVDVGFLERANPSRIMRDIRAILGRARLSRRELKILRGIARKVTRLSRYLPESEDPPVG